MTATIEGLEVKADEPMFRRGPSNILLVLIEGDSRLWLNLEVEELLYTEGDADIENDASMLEDALSECIGGEIKKPGRYLIEGFEASYTKDYEGEVDADYSITGWREAAPADETQFYIDESPDESPDEIRDCTTCKHSGCDPDGPYCGHDKSFAITGYGLGLNAMRLADAPCGPNYKLWETK